MRALTESNFAPTACTNWSVPGIGSQLWLLNQTAGVLQVVAQGEAPLWSAFTQLAYRAGKRLGGVPSLRAPPQLLAKSRTFWTAASPMAACR